MMELLFKLFAAHAIADYCLQNDYMATNKNRNAKPKGYDPALHGPMQAVWPYVLTGHALSHGVLIYLATGSVELGIAETYCHWTIDFGKCERWYGIHTDQWLHFTCKIIWAIAIQQGLA